MAIELIAERGLAGFSLAEASRRLGVTVAAPYRHFSGREEVLAAAALRAVREFGTALTGELDPASPPAQQLAAVAGAYVRFAATHQPLFGLLYGAGIDKSRYPQLQQAAAQVTGMLLPPARALAGDAGAEALITAVAAAAHGHAVLLLETLPRAGDGAVAAAVARARATALAIVEGRSALT